MPRLRILLLVLLLPACAAPDRSEAPLVEADAPVVAERGMVVSAHRLASAAGVEVLQEGGNAVDAAVATGFALAVVYPVAGNLGGGGFLVLRQPDGAATTIDYRETAPATATRDMYLDEEGGAVRRRSLVGPLAAGVPGSPAGLLYAHERYGSLPLSAVMAPALRLAEEGFVLSADQAGRFNGYRSAFERFPATRRYFTRPDSELFAEGDLFVQPDLAAVLTRLRDEGRAGFYQGTTAEQIVAAMDAPGDLPDGRITVDDLAAYEPVEREPVTFAYRGRRVLTMGPPSSGGVALAQLLLAVEPYDVAAMGFADDETVHLMGEAMRRAYADRAYWLGDPDFFDVPVERLTDPDYVAERMASFDPDQVTSSEAVSHGELAAFPPESPQTTHYSVVAPDGQAVSVTTTLNSGFGNKVVVDGAGFFLNNEMDDFSVKPGVPNQFGLVGAEANAVEPGKRMLSSMTPTIVEDEDGRLLFVIGSPGGSTIITTVFQTILNVVDHGMDAQQAVAAPRVHHQWRPEPLFYEVGGLPSETVFGLRERGWTVEEGWTTVGAPVWGAANGIVVRHHDDGTRTLYGGADPRRETAAEGL